MLIYSVNKDFKILPKKGCLSNQLFKFLILPFLSLRLRVLYSLSRVLFQPLAVVSIQTLTMVPLLID